MNALKRALPLLIILSLSGCGGESTAPTPSPSATPSPSTLPVKIEAHCDDSLLVGNWIDAKEKNLQINADCTASLGSQKLDWSLSEKAEVVFQFEKLTLDTCAYEVIPSGGLTEALKVVLQMICLKAGPLSYTKKP